MSVSPSGSMSNSDESSAPKAAPPGRLGNEPREGGGMLGNEPRGGGMLAPREGGGMLGGATPFVSTERIFSAYRTTRLSPLFNAICQSVALACRSGNTQPWRSPESAARSTATRAVS